MMQTVRAKMQCGSNEMDSNGNSQIRLYAVYSTDPASENKAFSDATPAASVTMTIAKGKPAAGFFETSKEYYVDFVAVA
jgi:hypothetical protein